MLLNALLRSLQLNKGGSGGDGKFLTLSCRSGNDIKGFRAQGRVGEPTFGEGCASPLPLLKRGFL
jgi:hypothetical protein